MDSKAVALLAAASAVARGTSPENVILYAEALIPWLTQPPAVRLDVDVRMDGRLIAHSSNGGDMAFTATPGVNTKFTVTVLPKDASDNTTADTIAFATDDTTNAILTPSVAGNTWTGTLTGTLGTVNLTATDTTTPSVPAYTAQLTVAAGATTHLVGSVVVT